MTTYNPTEKACLYAYNHGDQVTFHSLINTLNSKSKVFDKLSQFIVNSESDLLNWIPEKRKNRTEYLISNFGFEVTSIISDDSVILPFIGKRERLKTLSGFDRYSENERYCSIDIVENRVNLLKAAKGCGKTTTFKRFINDHCQGKSILVVTHRRSLNKELASNLNLSYYEDLKQIGIEALQACNRLAISPESLSFVSPEAFDVVIVDEVEQVLRHITHSDTMRGNGLTAFSWLANFFIPQAKTVILSDADLGSGTSELLKAAKIKDYVTITNEYLPRANSKDTIYVYECRDDVFSKYAADSRRTYGCSNERRYAEQFAALKDNSLLVTSETSKDVDHLVVKINEVVHNYDAICASPSMATGVSINAGHGIGASYSIFGNSTTTVTDCLQQIARVRDLGEHHCYIQSSCGDLPITAELVNEFYVKKPWELVGAAIGCNGKVVIDEYTQMKATVQAEINKSRNNMKWEFIKAARAEGFTVVMVEASGLKDEKVIEAKELAKENRELAKELKIAEKTEELKSLGDLAATVAELEIKKNLLSVGVKRLRMARMDKSQAMRQDKKERAQNMDHYIAASDVKNHSLKRSTALAVYKAAGFDVESFTLSGKSWNSDSKFILTLAEKHGKNLQSQFGISCNAKNLENPSRWFNGLLAKFGLFAEGESCKKGGQVNKSFSLPFENAEMLQVVVNKGL